MCAVCGQFKAARRTGKACVAAEIRMLSRDHYRLTCEYTNRRYRNQAASANSRPRTDIPSVRSDRPPQSDFIRKPIDGVELRSRVNAAISLREEQVKRFELERTILEREIERKGKALNVLSLQFSLNHQIVEKFSATSERASLEAALTDQWRKLKRIVRDSDISAITFVSYAGIRRARTRLRKKLHLNSQTDLAKFLKTLE